MGRRGNGRREKRKMRKDEEEGRGRRGGEKETKEKHGGWRRKRNKRVSCPGVRNPEPRETADLSS